MMNTKLGLNEGCFSSLLWVTFFVTLIHSDITICVQMSQVTLVAKQGMSREKNRTCKRQVGRRVGVEESFFTSLV
jgi:hypothetical protein